MAASSGTKLTPLRFVRSVLASFMAESGLEPRLFGQHLRIINAHMGIVDFELRITADHTNRLKILHGGTIASLVDLGGSLAVAAKGYYATGVSTDLNVTYLSSGGKEGDKLRGTAVCEKIGKTLAFTQVTFWDKERNLVARGSHTKFVALAVAGSEPFTIPEGAKIAPDRKPSRIRNKEKFIAIQAQSQNKSQEIPE
ncbi:Thioesterase/thiol ester dehydrase-isomerase [Parathielavia appendiculata]|uniref:Thioesterase/thiol ester dehydrase-isomerase n=1 Tax=Parathielavia appendiculata TaxID=2587402 RepID=A0AAN6Z6L0_9PEZI|nr:Thioesterase/thiol ester dehydrase-isomerase [Parathielavia appendiculata]